MLKKEQSVSSCQLAIHLMDFWPRDIPISAQDFGFHHQWKASSKTTMVSEMGMCSSTMCHHFKARKKQNFLKALKHGAYLIYCIFLILNRPLSWEKPIELVILRLSANLPRELDCCSGCAVERRSHEIVSWVCSVGHIQVSQNQNK